MRDEAGLPSSKDIRDLGTLDRNLIHLFVAGPGRGEGIAVALPGSGWLLVDSCRTTGGLPINALLSRFRHSDDPVVAVVLTHPHEDHADGMAELVQQAQPQHIVIAGPSTCSVDDLLSREGGRWSVLRERASTWSSHQRPSHVVNAIEGFQVAQRLFGTRIILGHDGCTLPPALTTAQVQVCVRGPSDDALQAFYSTSPDRARLLNNANVYSLILEVCHGSARLVLGGDLPNAGWASVLGNHVHLGNHRALKVPHHGSEGSCHEGLLTAAMLPRAWLLTPFNSAGLPTGPGVRALLEAEPVLHQTALSASSQRQFQHPPPGILTIEQLASSTRLARAGSRLEEGATELVSLPMAAEDPVWCVALDSSGATVGRWRGPVAVEIRR